jgi:hypothetical protein
VFAGVKDSRAVAPDGLTEGREMVTINRKVAGAALVGAAAAAIGLGVSAGARADTPTPTPTTSPSAPSTPGTPNPGSTNATPGPGGHGHGKGGLGRFGIGGIGKGVDLSALASKLGVDETKLRDALKAVRDDLASQLKSARKNATPGTKPDLSTLKDTFAQKLATELGISADKVKTAFADLEAAAQADRQKAFDDRLDQAVKDGKLTQAEADAVKKAAKEGVIGMGPGPR